MTRCDVAICAGLWRRLQLAPPWWQGVCRLRETWQAAGLVVDVVVGGSEPEHRLLAEQHGAVWVQVGNQPLGRKLNHTVQTAYRRGADYIVRFDADGFVDSALAAAYASHICAGTPYAGLAAVYHHELASGRTCLFGYPLRHPRFGEPLGHGRLLHRSRLEAVNGRPWQEHLDRSLDRSMTRRLGLRRAELIDVGPEAVALDVKTEDKIWSFDRMASAPGAGPVEYDPAYLRAVPEWEALRALRPAAAVA